MGTAILQIAIALLLMSFLLGMLVGIGVTYWIGKKYE